MSVSNLSVVQRRQTSVLGSRTAITWLQNGDWQTLTWAQVRRQADQIAAQLIRLGVAIGDRVGLLSESRTEWVIADLALLSIGAISVPLNPETPVSTLVQQLNHAGARGLICSSCRSTQLLLERLPADCPVRFVTCFDEDLNASSAQRSDSSLLRWRQWLEDSSVDPDITLLREQEVQPGDAATIIYTSGTTSQPKGVVLTHANFWHNASATAQVGGYGADDCTLSWLPFSHAFARTADLYVTMISGGTLSIAANADQISSAARTVLPTWITGVPRFFEKVWQQLESLPADQRPKRLKECFGQRIRHLVSGGGALPDRVASGFADSGVPLYQGYGLTEAAPVISFNNASHRRTGSVGRPLPNVEVRIGADAEIRTRGPHVMACYWRDPEATASTILNGWLHTGDLGRLDNDGFLYVTGRRKEVFKTSVGVSVVPNQLEARLCEDEAIDQVVVAGEQKPFVSALIVPNFEQLQTLKEQLQTDLNAHDGCLTSATLLQEYGERIGRLMSGIAVRQQVRRFLLLEQPLTKQAGLLTPTLKVKRSAVLRTFAGPLNAIYENDCRTLAAVVGDVQPSEALRD